MFFCFLFLYLPRLRRAGPTPVSAEGCCCCFFVSAMLCRGRVPQLGEEPGLPAPVSAEAWVFVCVCAPAMLCHDRVYQRGELGLPTPVSVEGWHVVYLPSGVMTGYPKEGAGPTHTCISGGMACCVPAIWCHDRIPQGGSWAYPSILYLLSCVIAGYPKEEKSWAYPHLCQWRGGGGCTCHVVYLLSCVMAGYPKEEKNWAYPHLCQWRDGGGGGLYLPCCVPVVLCHGRVPQGGEELGLPTPVSVEGWGGGGLYLPCCVPVVLCHGRVPQGGEELGLPTPVSVEGWRGRGGLYLPCCVPVVLCHGRVPQGGEELGLPTPVSVEGWRRGGGVYLPCCVPVVLCHGRVPQGGEELGLPTPVSVEGWRGGGGCTCHVVYLLSCVMAGYPKEEKSWAYPHLCQWRDGERGGVVPAMLCTCCLVSWQGTPRRRRAGPTHTCVSRWTGCLAGGREQATS